MNRSVSNEQILDPREKPHVLYPLRRVVSVIFLAGVLPGLISLAVRYRFGDVPHEHAPPHDALELVGSCIALGVAMLLMLRLRHEKTSPHLLWVVAALVAMGLIDGAHAVAPFGIAWSWLRHGATLVGGVLFALVWLPLPAVALRRPLWFAAGVAGLAIAASLAVWYDPAWLPAPWGQAGYTLTTKAANAAGGVGFLAAALFFLRRYLRQTETQDLVLAGHTLLFGTASLLFGFAHLWGADWWAWHGFRLLAYAVLLVAAYDLVATLYREIARHAQALEARTAELRRIEWLLAPIVKPMDWPETSAYEPPYGDLTELNTARLILDSVGKPMLTDIVKDYLDLLGTSAAVYEKNGDYALGLFSSGWCRFLDQASRGLCGAADNRDALACGKWHCHESCWTHVSKQCIKTGQPVDLECAGGLHLYAIPIRTGTEIIGSLNIGYGDPPSDPAKLQELAEKYGVSYEELSRQAKAYESRPSFIIELAKARLQASARLIAEIVERKRAEQELRLANARFRRFVEANIVGIVIAMPAGEILEANDYYLNLIGYSRQELEQGQVDWRAVTPPEWLPADEQAILEMRDRGSSTPYEKEYLRRDGRRVPVLLVDTMLPGPDEQIAAFCLDMSERKRTEAALRQRAEEVERLLEVVPAAIFVSSDPGCRRIVGNQQANQIFEAKPEENLSASAFPEARRYYGPDGREITADELPMQVAAATNQEVRDAEMVVRSASGRVLSLLGNAVPLRDEHGGVRGCIGAFLDITERKRIEAEVKRLNVELEQRVEGRTAELRSANAELESFAYAVSHDLRAPLRAMSGFSQALLEDYGERLDGEARVYLDQISLASRRMSELIDGLLTLSRSTRGELKQEALDISAVSERLLAEMTAAEPARRVAWTVEPGMDAQGDATMIEVVMRNLIDNAWKYTGKTPDAAIRVYSEETDGQRCFCVSDNGAGFDMAHAGKLFQPFQRLHRQEEFPGIGIGLPTVQRIVHRHGGAIWADGAPGQGATFCFTLHNPNPLGKEIS